MKKRGAAECWVDNPEVARIAKRVEAMLAGIPEFVDRLVKTEIRERAEYVQVHVVCTFRVPK